jgi:hypothetical protein
MPFDAEISESVAYLGSPEAMRALEASPYWPKWHSPWWHMLLLYEMGEGRRIPDTTIRQFILSLNASPVKIFPIHAHEMPADANPFTLPCHCQLGNVHLVLTARGVDVDQELPWITPWFAKYQMADGGLNCDESAYLVANEIPSSLTGTIAAFEALLRRPGPWSTAETCFVNRAAALLIERRLTRGSPTKHNAAERDSARHWLTPAFPRFYHYDALRGLDALTLWAARTGTQLPPEAISHVTGHFTASFPDGAIRIGRNALAGAGTIAQTPEGPWGTTHRPASDFPLLTAVSTIGEVSPFLTASWAAIRERLARPVG